MHTHKFTPIRREIGVDDSEHRGTVWDAVASITRLGTPASAPGPADALCDRAQTPAAACSHSLSVVPTNPPTTPPARTILAHAHAEAPSDGHPQTRLRRLGRLSAISGTEALRQFRRSRAAGPRGGSPTGGLGSHRPARAPATAKSRQSKREINGLGARGENP
jgi:hypothetical protein